MMFVHVYYKDGGESELGMSAPRVTVFTGDRATRYEAARYEVEGPVLVIGTLPNISVIPLSKIDYFWVEEN